MISEDKKIELIKRAISSTEGWRNLALSLQGKPEAAREECIRLLKIIGANKIIDVPAIDEKTGDTEVIQINFSDKLIEQLDENIAQLSKEST